MTPAMILRKYPWISHLPFVTHLATLFSKHCHRQGLGRCQADFNTTTETQCEQCGAPLFSAATKNTLSHYKHCRKCNVLLSCEPMPDYGNEALYSPTNEFIEENVSHYQRLFLARPKLLEELGKVGVNTVIDLAGGIGIFPRLVTKSMSSVKDVVIVEVGEYASTASLHQMLSLRLGTNTPVSFVHKNVFDFLLDSQNVCSGKTLISCVHFIDHLRAPDNFLKALCQFARGKEVYVLIYCHALDSYKGNDWFVINTATQGEHQILYSQSALQRLLSQYGTILHSDIYFDDQYLLLKLKGATTAEGIDARS